MKKGSLLKNLGIIIVGAVAVVLFGIIFSWLAVSYYYDKINMINDGKYISCYRKQERNIPFKVIGVLRFQEEMGMESVADVMEYKLLSVHDFGKFDLNRFVLASGQAPQIDYSKMNMVFVVPNVPGRVLDVKIQKVKEKSEEPSCFDCFFDCAGVIVDVDIQMRLSKQKPIFNRIIILMELNAPIDWHRDKVEFFPHVQFVQH